MLLTSQNEAKQAQIQISADSSLKLTFLPLKVIQYQMANLEIFLIWTNTIRDIFYLLIGY